MSAEEITPEEASSNWSGAGLNMMELLPDFFERFFAFFRPGHTEGVTPSRIKEIARIKIASLNGCDT
jgi:hypothetical protein